jgi:hypothetical protein
MSLFQFELKKLLVNKRTIIILAVLFVVYGGIGFGSTYFLVGSGQNYETCANLAKPHEGPLSRQRASEVQKSYEALKERYGGRRGSPVR